MQQSGLSWSTEARVLFRPAAVYRELTHRNDGRSTPDQSTSDDRRLSRHRRRLSHTQLDVERWRFDAVGARP